MKTHQIAKIQIGNHTYRVIQDNTEPYYKYKVIDEWYDTHKHRKTWDKFDSLYTALYCIAYQAK